MATGRPREGASIWKLAGLSLEFDEIAVGATFVVALEQAIVAIARGHTEDRTVEAGYLAGAAGRAEDGSAAIVQNGLT
jgi:hypothetical protein